MAKLLCFLAQLWQRSKITANLCKKIMQGLLCGSCIDNDRFIGQFKRLIKIGQIRFIVKAILLIEISRGESGWDRDMGGKERNDEKAIQDFSTIEDRTAIQLDLNRGDQARLIEKIDNCHKDFAPYLLDSLIHFAI